MASAGNAFGSDHFPQRPFTRTDTVIGTTDATLGPWKLPLFNGQSGELVTVWITSTGAWAVTVGFQAAPTANGPWAPVGDPTTTDVNDDSMIQSSLFGGEFMRLVLTTITNPNGINITTQVKTRG